MGNYTIFFLGGGGGGGEVENPRRGREARKLTTNVPKILDLKSSSEQIISKKLTLGAPVLTFESVEETSWCASSNETSSAILSHGTISLVFSTNFSVCI